MKVALVLLGRFPTDKAYGVTSTATIECLNSMGHEVTVYSFDSVPHPQPSAARSEDDRHAAQRRERRGAQGDRDSGLRAVSGLARVAAARDGREDPFAARAGAAGRIVRG